MADCRPVSAGAFQGPLSGVAFSWVLSRGCCLGVAAKGNVAEAPMWCGSLVSVIRGCIERCGRLVGVIYGCH